MKIFNREISVFNKNHRVIEEKGDKIYLPCNVLFGNLKRAKIEQNIEKRIKSV